MTYKSPPSDPDPVSTALFISNEREYMKPAMAAWDKRAEVLGLRKGTKSFEYQRDAYIQGVCQMARHVGKMPDSRYGIIAFMTACGRLDSMVDLWQKED